MITTRNSQVLVVLMDEQCVPGLDQASKQNRWPILRRPNAGQALREIRLARPSVVVVQVSGSVMVLEQAASLMRWLGNTGPRTVAIAGEHTELVERSMRAAGAACYLADDAGDEQIDQAVAQLGAPHQRNTYRIGA